MKKIFILSVFIAVSFSVFAQISSKYTISFENAVHHEAQIAATFSNLPSDSVILTMSRTSPGRYALHEFVKNVYDLKVTDTSGKELTVERIDPYSWNVINPTNTINVSYTLFANHGDGTYAQVDETHAHLNMPATFMYVPSLSSRSIEVTFNVREDLNWKVATQLKKVSGTTYNAPNLQYFMDSPTEIGDHDLRGFMVGDQRVKFVLNHNGTEAEFDEYFEKVKAIVLEQEAIFGELPQFDYNEYLFLASYLPQATGDGMEHRNSTVLTSTRSLANGGMQRNISTVSHEFFHCWNVERIRPKDLEPFDFSKANMSDALWFAEGFTSYYTTLTLKRTALRTTEEYIKGITGTFNYVWNSPGRHFFNPIEMSNQAPFVDAAKSVDPTNRSNTFISYYSYGNMLGLALDLMLREKGLNLDEYMRLVWFTFGKDERPFSIEDIKNTLVDYAGKEFGTDFFDNYIYQSKMPDMKRLLANVGVELRQKETEAYLGARFKGTKITRNTIIDGPAYKAGLELGDELLTFGEAQLNEASKIEEVLKKHQPGDIVKVTFKRFGKVKETSVTVSSDPNYEILPFEALGKELTQEQKAMRDNWLSSKQN